MEYPWTLTNVPAYANEKQAIEKMANEWNVEEYTVIEWLVMYAETHKEDIFKELQERTDSK